MAMWCYLRHNHVAWITYNIGERWCVQAGPMLYMLWDDEEPSDQL